MTFYMISDGQYVYVRRDHGNCIWSCYNPTAREVARLHVVIRTLNKPGWKGNIINVLNEAVGT